MRTRNQRGRIFGAITVAVVVVLGVVAPAFAQRGALKALPPNGVFTCDWIAAHPAAAAQAGVTCDPSVFLAASSSETAAPASSAGLVTPDANDCQNLPHGGGRVGMGVFAWSYYEYADQWTFFGNYGPSYYTWYLQKTGEITYVYGTVTDTSSHSIGVPANIYRWGAQNHSPTPQSWKVCYAV